MINLSSYAKALKPGVDIRFGGACIEKPQEYQEIFEMRQSSQNFEEAVNHYGFGLAVVKPQGESIAYDDAGQGALVRFVHIVYGLGFFITREAVEDNLYNQIAEQRAKFLARSMRQTKEINAALVLDRAFNSSYVGFDGVQLCSTAHVLQKTNGTYNNKLTTDADLSEESMRQMDIDIANFRDDANNRILVRPRKLIVPKELKFDAEVLLKTQYQLDSANNNISPVYSTGIIPGGYTVNHYLGDTDAWFVLTDADDGMVMYQRRAMEMDNDTPDFDTENMKFKTSERYSLGWIDPRGIYGSQGA